MAVTVLTGTSATIAAIRSAGLTNLTDLAFAPDGSLYAVEIASNGLLNGPIGALVKINPGGSQHETVVGACSPRTASPSAAGRHT